VKIVKYSLSVEVSIGKENNQILLLWIQGTEKKVKE
jgi:hypothetical protein